MTGREELVAKKLGGKNYRKNFNNNQENNFHQSNSTSEGKQFHGFKNGGAAPSSSKRKPSKRKYNENKSEYAFSLLAYKNIKLSSPEEKVASEETKEFVKTKVIARLSKLIGDFHSMTSDSVKDQIIGIMPKIISEASEMKNCGNMSILPIETLVQFLTDLMSHVNIGCNLLSVVSNNSQTSANISPDDVLIAAGSSLICLIVLTSPEMPKRVYIEEIIDSLINLFELFVKNVLLPCDIHCKQGNLKIKKFKNIKQRENITQVENAISPKLEEFITLFGELLAIQTLLEDSFLKLFSTVVSLYLVDDKLKRACLKIIAVTLLRYESHKILLFDKILVCISLIPQTRLTFRSITLKTKEQIHPLTNLLLEIIQALLAITDENISRSVIKVADNNQNVLFKRHKQSVTLTGVFVSYFLNKSENKFEQFSYKNLFEIFVQDLIVTCNKIEYPVAKLALAILGKLFIKNITSSSCAISLKIVSIDFLAQITLKLRAEGLFLESSLADFNNLVSHVFNSTKDSFSSLLGTELEVDNQDIKNFVMQYIFLHYLYTHEEYDTVKYFYFVNWCIDNMDLKITTKNEKVPAKKARKSKSNEISGSKSKTSSTSDNTKTLLSDVLASEENSCKTSNFKNLVTYEKAHLILRHLASNNVSNSFDTYLSIFVSTLKSENPVLIRTKIMKSLTAIVEADPAVFEKSHIQAAVSTCLHDSVTSLRENAVDLIGKCLKNQPKFMDRYYTMVTARCVDSAISVRKRVIKILDDLSHEKKYSSKRLEIYLLMIRRIKDEEGVKKMIIDIFKSKWFTLNSKKVHDQIQQMVNTVVLATEADLDCLTKLLYLVIKGVEEDSCVAINAKLSKEMLSVCKKMIKTIMEKFLQEYRENSSLQEAIAIARILHIFAKIVPELVAEYLVDFSECLKGYQLNSTESVIAIIIKIVELLLPFVRDSKKSIMQELEECMLHFVSSLGKDGVDNCLSCLNKLSNNYEPIKGCLLINFSRLKSLKLCLKENNLEKLNDPQYRHHIRRALFTVAHIIKNVNFEEKPVDNSELDIIVRQIYELMVSFLHVGDTDIKMNTLNSIGNICIRHPQFMLENSLQEVYRSCLRKPDVEVDIKITILENICDFIFQEDSKIFQKYRSQSAKIRDISLKAIDSSSTIGSLVVQNYMDEILQAYLHKDSKIRASILRLIRLILTQGIAHPIQVTPFLICMSSDTDENLSDCAISYLHDLEKKYPGFIQTRLFPGIKLSYQLQKVLQDDFVIRGVKIGKNGKSLESINRILYSLLQNNKKQRRALVIGMLKAFEHQSADMLGYQLYLADNLAYFPYNTLEEPLFVVHNIDTLVSIVGANILEQFKNSLNNDTEITKENEGSAEITLGQNADSTEKTVEENGKDFDSLPLPIDDDESDNEETLLKSLPNDIFEIQQCLKKAQGCFLLLTLKKHLKTMYGLNDAKIQQYYPEITDKNLVKPVVTKKVKFDPKMVIEELTARIEVSDEELRKKVVSQFVRLKSLILEFDAD